MATNITINVSATLLNGSLKASIPATTVTLTQSNAEVYSGTETLTTSEANWSHPTTGGTLFMTNISTSNNAIYGPNNSGNMVTLGKLVPSMVGVLNLSSGAVVRAKSSASTCVVNWTWWRD